MNHTVLQATNILDILTVKDQEFALAFLKKLVLAWDPDFTKLTKEEERRLDEADAEYAHGEYVQMDI